MSKSKIINKRDGKYLTIWKVLGDDTTQWSWRLSFWRLELGLTVYRHEYPDYPFKTKTTGDRWVFHPSLVYDRKSKPKTPNQALKTEEKQ